MATLLEDRLRSLADQVPLPDPAVTDRVVAGVTDALQSEPPLAARDRRRPMRGRRRRRVFVAMAFVAATGAATLAVGSPSGDGSHIDAAAAAALRRAAIVAARQPALPPLGPGRFYHFRDTETGWVERARAPLAFTSCATACPPPPPDWVVKARVTAETWIAADGRGLRTIGYGRATFRSPAVRRTYRRMYGFPVSHPFGVSGPPLHLSPSLHPFGWGLSYRQLQHLPTNPDRLGEIVREVAAPSSQAADPFSSNTLTFEEFEVIGDMMRSSPLRPGVRAAFYTILSRLPGITFVGRVTDPLGRPGIEVAVKQTPDADPSILIFDPHTAQLLSEGGGGYSGWGVVTSFGGHGG